MNENTNKLAALASLAHSALNSSGTEYAQVKAMIAQFFAPSCAVSHKEEVRLTLIDSWFSTNVASRRLFGISDIANRLRAAFKNGDAEAKEAAAQWIAGSFDGANPLCALFAEKYGVNKAGEERNAAYSLLSKYLYFATDYAFPIYDNLGANYYYLAGELNNPDFTARFRTLQKIMRENAIDGFDQMDNFFWLYGKVDTGSFSLVLNKEKYAALSAYQGDAVKDIRAGNSSPALQNIFGPDMAAFIQKSAETVSL
ncbi:MAG: hypothetical protein LBD20_10515 [Spirochaetaceae bacterium]|jgi:hypothetical protein|nr:hypothetical protein [Spirochaetaceae bacterium]